MIFNSGDMKGGQSSSQYFNQHSIEIIQIN